MPENMTPETRPGPAPTLAARSSSTSGSGPTRPGRCERYRRSVPAPAGLGLEIIGVPEGAPLALDMPLQSVTEGVLVTGTVTATVARRVRAVPRPGRRRLARRVCELFAYPDSATDETTRAGRGPPDRARSASTSNRWCVTWWCWACPGRRCAGRTVPGCAPNAGSGSTTCRPVTRTSSSTRVGPALAGSARRRPARPSSRQQTDVTASARPKYQENPRGRSEAEDVAQQHPRPPFAVEDDAPTLVLCPNRACGEMKLPHTACSNCGQYDGKQVLAV